jgi:hypothetical protein
MEPAAWWGAKAEKRRKQVELIERQTKAGTLTIRQATVEEIERLDRARDRRLVAVILPVDDTPAAA